MTTRVGRGVLAVAAVAALSACGEPRTKAEYEYLTRVHLGVGAASGLVLMGLVLAFRAWRRRGGPERLALGPESDTAVVAAYSSLAALAVLVAVAGALAGSVLLPDDPVLAEKFGIHARQIADSRYLFAAVGLALFVLPCLAALGALLADFVEYPPRGVGAVPVALLHALLAVVVLQTAPYEPAGRELVLRWLLAAPMLVGAAAYLALHVGWWRSASSAAARRS